MIRHLPPQTLPRDQLPRSCGCSCPLCVRMVLIPMLSSIRFRQVVSVTTPTTTIVRPTPRCGWHTPWRQGIWVRCRDQIIGRTTRLLAPPTKLTSAPVAMIAQHTTVVTLYPTPRVTVYARCSYRHSMLPTRCRRIVASIVAYGNSWRLRCRPWVRVS